MCYNIIHDVNDIAKEEMIEAKDNKGQSYKNENKLRARGKARQSTALSTVMKRHLTIEEAMKDPTLKDCYGEIAKRVNVRADSFKSVRVGKEYEYNMNRSSKERRQNQYEKVTGFDVTGEMADGVRFSAATNAYKEGVKAELIARGVNDLSNLKSIRELKNELKKLCAKEANIPLKECIYFQKLSSYDWSKITN